MAFKKAMDELEELNRINEGTCARRLVRWADKAWVIILQGYITGLSDAATESCVDLRTSASTYTQ